MGGAGIYRANRKRAPPPSRPWTQLDPGGGRRRRGQLHSRGGGGARGLEAEPGAVSPAPAVATAVPYTLWPGWLPTLSSAARHPSIPSCFPLCWPGAQVRLVVLPRHCFSSSVSFRSAGAPSGLCQPRGSLCLPGAVPGGGTTVFPSPPHHQAPRLHPRYPGRSSVSPCGAGPELPLPGRLHNRCGWRRRSPPHSWPHTCPRNALPGRGQRPSARLRPRKVSLCGPGLLTSRVIR